MSALLSHRGSLGQRCLVSVSIVALVAIALLSSQAPRLDSRIVPGTQRNRSAPDTPSKLPMAFEPNGGQADPAVRYVAHGGQSTLLFAQTSVTLLLEATGDDLPSYSRQVSSIDRLGMEFLGANPAASLEQSEELPGKVSYLMGNDPARWHTNLPTYGKLTYRNLYPGIDLEYEGSASNLKGTYMVPPGTDPTTIRWRYSSTNSPVLDNDELILSAGQTQLRELAPVAWQQIDNQKVDVSVGYVVYADGSVGFRTGSYDHGVPLVIDPTLAYSTYLGGAGSDSGIGIAVDSDGNTYVTGPTSSTNFPLMDPFQPSYAGNTDLFITKINAEGTVLVYSTYLGGSQSEISWGIAVDDSGNAYLAGSTTSDDFPVVNAFQPTRAGGEDVVVVKINAKGAALDYATYLGGTGDDEAWHIAQRDGYAYVTGKTASTDFPTTNPYQPANAGGKDIFVTKLDISGQNLVYSTYLGGSADEESLGIAVDLDGTAYISGGSHSTDYPLHNPYQPTNRGGEDVVVTKLTRAGDALAYSTYLGGSGDEVPWGVALSGVGDAFLTGVTDSPDFPVRQAIQPVKGAALDGFVTRLAPSGSWIVYSTYLGGNGSYDAPYGIASDPEGDTYISSLTDSTDFPLANPIQSTYGGNSDASVSMFDPLGVLLFSTYLGGSEEDFAWRIAVDGHGNVYTAGLTRSSDFPTANPLQPVNAGSPDAFVLKITDLPGPTPTPVSCTTHFTDVPPGSTFYPYIRCLVCEGLVSGYDDETFRPNNPTTRGQLAKIVANAAGFTEPVTGQTYHDVPPGSSFYPYIEHLTARGLVSGYQCGGAGEPCVAPDNLPYFRPGNDVTRGQAAKIVAGTAAFPDPPPGEQRFEDVPPDQTFFPWVETMAWLDLISGYQCGGAGEPCVAPDNLPYFRPGNDVTRGQAAKIVAGTFLAGCINSQAASGK